MSENQSMIRIQIPAKTYIKYYLKKQGYPLRLPCHSECKCAECLIRVVDGRLDASLRDIQRLSPELIKQGYRLGCQAVTITPVTIEFSKSQIQEKHKNKKLFGR